MALSPRVVGLVAAIAMLAVDQAHKIWMLDVFRIGERPPVRLLPVLDIVMAWNTGISYSLFRAGSFEVRWALVALALAAVLALAIWLWRADNRALGAGLGLIIGGALGNAYDRATYGAVADFFHFHTPFSLGPLSNYVFNLADVGIVAGVALLLYDSLRHKENIRSAATTAEPVATEMPEKRG